MIEFKRLGENVKDIEEYIKNFGGAFCDLSLGVRYMWQDDFIVDYAVFNDTLIMKETNPDYANAFYYPLGNDAEGALNAIEKFCKANNVPLLFCCLDNARAVQFANRYFSVSITNDRDWSDYIYDAEKFKTYSGKKYGGQRNHVNKFKKLYPNYKFKIIEESDFSRIEKFLEEFNSKAEFLRWSEQIEQKKVFDLVKKINELNQVGGLLEVDGKVVAFSIGEKINDVLIVHVEKALTKYDGVYPTMAQEFAKAFATDKIKYINREEDCGDEGLRISKLQYHPIDVKEKNLVKVKTLFDRISAPIIIKTERLILADITDSEKDDYYRLYMDDKLNEMWGYDYREDLNGNTPSPDYFLDFQRALKEKKEEYSLAIKKENVMIGEVVLHNFDYFGGVEIGVRLFREYHGKGYAREAVSALKDYAFSILGAKTVKSRCYKENAPSKKLFTGLGLKTISEDERCYYFAIDKE